MKKLNITAAKSLSHQCTRRELEFRLSQLVPNKSTTIILYDNNDQRARLAAETLQRNGYTNIHVLKGGLIAWQEAGNPLVEGVNVPAKYLEKFLHLGQN